MKEFLDDHGAEGGSYAAGAELLQAVSERDEARAQLKLLARRLWRVEHVIARAQAWRRALRASADCSDVTMAFLDSLDALDAPSDPGDETEGADESTGRRAQRRIAAWFREVALLDDRSRAHLGLGVTLGPEACLEVAEILERGVSFFSCNVDEADQTGIQR